ncbi:MAG: type III ribulose-bisphosphate carboxylase [Nitrososphaera sp.]|nr:type III ribulose-bisphosphate carboxylase [Nitrososphaera sp.]
MGKKSEWYADFVNLKYAPNKDAIVCLFRFEPLDEISATEVMGRIASESSVGTWTTLTSVPKMLPRLKAFAFWRRGKFCKVAYPVTLFEQGSITGFLAGPAGNIFGMKAVKSLRLVDVELPLEYVKHFRGPNFGTSAIGKIFKKKSGPITAVVPKPKLGYTASEHAEKVAYAVWRGGIDCVKDDENLTNQTFNKFYDRVERLARVRDKAEKETGQVKEAFINVTAPDLKQLENRIKTVHDHGFRYFMLDVVISGFTAVQTASNIAHDYGMAIHAHRAMHAMFTRNQDHGMSMLFLAKLMRLIGIDQLHIGTVVGKLEGRKNEIIATKDMILFKEVNEIPMIRLHQNWGKIKPMLPVASGGLHPGLLPQVFDIYKTTDMVVQVGGGTQGHPMGVEAGAKAVVQAIEAYHQSIDLREYARDHAELGEALKKWGFTRPK